MGTHKNNNKNMNSKTAFTFVMYFKNNGYFLKSQDGIYEIEDEVKTKELENDIIETAKNFDIEINKDNIQLEHIDAGNIEGEGEEGEIQIDITVKGTIESVEEWLEMLSSSNDESRARRNFHHTEFEDNLYFK